MNKYLEKVAFFGFSKEEKRSKFGMQLYVALFNHVGAHGNDILREMHADPKNESLTGKEFNRKYFAALEKYKPLRDEFKPIYNDFVDRAKKLGADIEPDHNKALDRYLEDEKRNFSAYM